MISQTEKTQIRQALQTPQWRTVEAIANEICDKIAMDSVIRPTQWETLKTALLNEGQIQGIKRLVQELYQLAQYDDQTGTLSSTNKNSSWGGGY